MTENLSYRAFRVFGPRRSGHHAVINWLVKQLSGQVHFIHNLEEAKEGVGHCYKVHDGEVLIADDTYLASDQEFETFGEGELQAVVYNLEDCSWEKYQSYTRKVPVPQELPTTTVLILRDPLNLLASRVKTFLTAKIEQLIWEAPLNFYFHWCLKMMEGEAPTEDFVYVSYPHWFTSKSYREELATKLRVPFSDEGLDQQIEESSFDGFSYADRDATQMKVLERYHKMKDEELFRTFLKEYGRLIDHINQGLFSEFQFPACESILTGAGC